MCVVVVGGRGQGPAEGGGGGGQGRRSIPTLEEGDCGVSLSLGRAESLPALCGTHSPLSAEAAGEGKAASAAGTEREQPGPA